MTDPTFRFKPTKDTLVALGNDKVFYDLGTFSKDGSPENSNLEPGWFKTMLFISDSDLSATEIDHLASLIGYYWKVTVKGPAMTGITRIATNAFILKTDFYASKSYNPIQRFGQFVNGLNDFLLEGSPVRKGNTRLVEPFNRAINLSVRVDELADQSVADAIVSGTFYDREENKPPAPMPKLSTPEGDKPPAPMPNGSKRFFGHVPLDASVSLMALDIAKEFLPTGEQQILELAMEVVKQNTELKAKLKENEATLKAIKKIVKR